MSSNMKPFADHYKVLGVNSEADFDVIKKAYKKLVLLHHPDKGGDQAKFIAIKEAYEVLSDSTGRAAFDKQRKKQKEQQNSSPSSSASSKSSSYPTGKSSSSQQSSTKDPSSGKAKQQSAPRKVGPTCGYTNCPNHVAVIHFSQNDARRMTNSHKTRAAKLYNALLEVRSQMHPQMCHRPGNLLKEVFAKALHFIDYSIESLDIWERWLAVHSPWGYCCEDFELLERLRRMAQDLKLWEAYCMSNIDGVVTRFRSSRNHSEEKSNCFVDLEVQLALWPRMTWPVGFPEYDEYMY